VLRPGLSRPIFATSGALLKDQRSRGFDSINFVFVVTNRLSYCLYHIICHLCGDNKTEANTIYILSSVSTRLI